MNSAIRSVSSTFASVLVLSVALTATFGASADTIALIGTGNVAGALGPEFAMQGHDIVYGSRNPDRAEVRELVARTGGNAFATGQAEAAAMADIVVIAVPGNVAEQVVASLGDLSGKIIIDPTNRVGPGDDGFMMHTVATSNAELIQALAPDAYVVKAFNTLNYRTMIDPELSGGPVTIPLVGNNAEAKATVAALVEGMGLESIDLGPVRFAHVLEGMLVIWINGRSAGTPYDYYLRLQPQ
ncbi:MAG: NAD(P)-binding domain-containing protein [Gammaproteobacteria bacterium]|nr:NAD(P)-binding domain-containing protein [Gammaproteobacteria bacterium]